ncbi:MAG TPA: hypothetical protein PLV95_00625 [Candidatus Pacearchaeota archaeon]|nr:hypothetical protein [Candidatus Pacearchaeota archaeon]
MTINEINTLLESAEFTDFLVPLKAVFLFLSLFMVCFGVYYFIKQEDLLKEYKRKINNFLSQQHFNIYVDLASQWKEIKSLLPAEDQITYRLIVRKISNLFFDILEKSNLSDKKLEEIDESKIPGLREIKEIIAIDEKLRENEEATIDIQRVKELATAFERTLVYLKII